MDTKNKLKKSKKALDTYSANSVLLGMKNRRNMKDSTFKHFNPMALREKYSVGKNTNSKFWFDDSPRTSIFDEEVEVKRGVDHIQLASYRRAIANFVTIVTGDSSIPVKFQSNDQSYTDGKVVTIGSKINEKSFDPTVGVALHEGSHIKLSDFNFVKNLEFEIPQSLYILGKSKGYNLYDTLGHVKNMLNYVEDRRIDWYVFSTSPGYKGYYNSMYDKYFHSKVIDKALLTDEYTSLDWDSYQFRIINLTNKNSRLEVLPELSSIYDMIFKNNGGVKKMNSTREAFQVAKKVVEMIYKVLPEGIDKVDEDGNTSKKPLSELNSKEDTGLSNEEFERLKEKAENNELGSGDGSGKEIELTEAQKKSLERAFQKQKDFVDGNVSKTGKLSKKDSNIIKSMEDAGVDMKKVGSSLMKEEYDYHSGEYVKIPQKGLNCIFVKKITDSMITENVFPHLFNWRRWSTDLTDLHPQISEMLTKGVTLGKKLGRKLQIRGESRDTKWSRLDSGRIDKRLISELGFGNDRVFSTTFVEKFSDAFLHISIDASGSMNGEKWDNTMISTIAICKAASMIDNVDVVVSFRTTHESGGRTSRTSNYLPLVAIGYDSRVDKFSKILRHFGWINPGGTTPEGLCFEAIMNEIVPTVRDRDSYFLNLSDGMPMFSNSELYYHDTEALNHTKKMVDEIRKKGVKILSYYVGDEYDRSRSMEDFKRMYGKDASFINVTNVMEVSKSMNKMFLEKSNG